jgi:hypothetical protein
MSTPNPNERVSAPAADQLDAEVATELEGLDFDTLLSSPEPVIELRDPKSAPEELLAQVEVDTEGQRLVVNTELGQFSVELYFGNNEDSMQENRTTFHPAANPVFDPSNADNPLPTQEYPYAILPDHSLYEVIVRAPETAVDLEWSAGKTVPIETDGIISKFTGTSLASFKRAFPNVDVSHIAEGDYTITATEESKKTIALLARVEDGEPLARRQEVQGDTVKYQETLFGDVYPSGLQPDTVVAPILARATFKENGEADVQRLEFVQPDGFQRVGEEAVRNSGLFEVIIIAGEVYQLTNFLFKPYERPRIPDFSYESTKSLSFGSGPMTRSALPVGGLTGGETRYRPPETVQATTVGFRNGRVIAAAKFAMTGVVEPEL